jgi:hypothetical protein
MRILTFLTDPPVVQGILLHLDLDQTLEFDLTEPDPIPEYEFDQSIPDDFAS